MGLLIDKIIARTISLGIFLAILAVVALGVAGCGGIVGSLTSASPPSSVHSLTASDVTALIQSAAQAASPNTMVIAVVDRAGRESSESTPRKPAAPTLAAGNFGAQVDVNELAVSLARTGAFFSNDQAPLSSRTVRFISGIHFPPGIYRNIECRALRNRKYESRMYAVSTSFIAGQSLPPARSISGASTGLGRRNGQSGRERQRFDCGQYPVRRAHCFATGALSARNRRRGSVRPDVAEYAAYAAATSNGFGPTPAAHRRGVRIDGVALPFVNQTTRPASVGAGSFTGSFIAGPSASPGPPAEGMLVAPVAGPQGGLLRLRRRQNYQ